MITRSAPVPAALALLLALFASATAASSGTAPGALSSGSPLAVPAIDVLLWISVAAVVLGVQCVLPAGRVDRDLVRRAQNRQTNTAAPGGLRYSSVTRRDRVSH